MIRSLRKRLN